MNTYIQGATNNTTNLCAFGIFFSSKIDIEHLKCGRITRQNENFKKTNPSVLHSFMKKKIEKRRIFGKNDKKKYKTTN